ncbi:DUF5131 family protein [Gordonia soli]|uniref:Phage Gp37Gp68 family protein n=1 Tax=Gordonia soli NBRC 108243 TaxID=1223545 RepID=M0QQZ8_9ACTN|nr:phage Gp37/Gp68 family protein [Gordonia soli]GAC70814.1 hypothetical protein GS4_41_00630 [Gordonia soli NBRC 108243]
MATKIEWTDETWNPVTGCTKLSPASPGCENCYASTFAERFRGTPGHYFENGFDVQLRPDKLDQPLRWRRPRKVFVNSMSDLFHEAVPDEYIAQVFAVMALAPRHTFQVLTKRHGRMRSLLGSADFAQAVADAVAFDSDLPTDGGAFSVADWPLLNVWLGVSTENQQWADIRIPALLDTPAAVRFISAEPLLGPIELSVDALGRYYGGDPREDEPGLDWVIVGGESGRGARPMNPDWARELRDQCVGGGVPFLFKQWGEFQPVVPDHPDNRSVNDYLVSPKNGDAMRIGDYPHASGLVPSHFATMRHVGKKTAGRELDGRTWDEYPGGEG